MKAAAERGPPLVDEDWHAVEAEWKTMDHLYVELHKAVNCTTSGGKRKAKAPWSFKRSERQRNTFPRFVQRKEDQNEIPSKVGLLIFERSGGLLTGVFMC